jgi:hypothetical protein
MMVLPFVGLAAGMAAVLTGRQRVALCLWLVSLIGTLALFAAHATSTLNLDF